MTYGTNRRLGRLKNQKTHILVYLGQIEQMAEALQDLTGEPSKAAKQLRTDLECILGKTERHILEELSSKREKT